MIFSISPYKFKGTWVFDDPSRNLNKEAFVQGADNIIDIISSKVMYAKNGFILEFSDASFDTPEQFSISWLREEYGGNLYVLDGYNIEGWLCPALFKFFPTVPLKIYIKVREECLYNIIKNKFTNLLSFEMPTVMRS